MKWIKHFSNSRRNLKVQWARDRLGEVAYGRIFQLFEILAEQCGSGAEFSPALDLKKSPASLGYVARELQISPKATRATLNVLADAGVIDKEAWTREVIFIPQLLEYRDEFSSRKPKQNSEPTHEPVGSESGVNREESRAELELEQKEKQKQTSNPAAAAVHLRPWKNLKLEGPIGSLKFQKVWTEIYQEKPEGTDLVPLMEAAIQRCLREGIKVPPPFYQIKHELETEPEPKPLNVRTLDDLRREANSGL